MKRGKVTWHTYVFIDLRSPETILKWFTRNLNIRLKIQDGCHDIFYSTSVWYFIIIWSLTKGKSQETVFHSCIVLAKASYNRISCMCLPHSCWVAIVQHGGHCEWCKKWDHWKWMDVARKHIYLTQVCICLFELISNQSRVIIL